MGTEIVFLLIYPVALVCAVAAFGFWFDIAKKEHSSPIGVAKGYMPLVTGFAVSLVGLALLTYVQTDADFTWLIEHGYYTEAEQGLYLPRRVVGQAVVNLVFVLPAISFVVIPLTAGLIRRRRLTPGAIGARAVIGWVALSFIGWIFSQVFLSPPVTLLSFLKSALVPVSIYGLPIPAAALLFRHKMKVGSETDPHSDAAR
jgi:hypothetical protein